MHNVGAWKVLAGFCAVVLFAAPFGAADAGQDESKNQPLVMAARDGRLEEVRRLLSEGADPNASDADGSGATPLIWAANNGHREIVVLLLDNGADVNRSGSSVLCTGVTPLMEAAGHGHHTLVKLLLDKGANINDRDGEGLNALLRATIPNRIKVAKVLTDRGVDPDSMNEALTLASYLGYSEIVKVLISRGAGCWAAN